MTLCVIPLKKSVLLALVCQLFDAERRGRHSQTEFGNENENPFLKNPFLYTILVVMFISRSQTPFGNAFPDAPRRHTNIKLKEKLDVVAIYVFFKGMTRSVMKGIPKRSLGTRKTINILYFQ